MRMLMRATLPVEASNAAVDDGRMQKLFQTTIDRLKPEAAYFCAVDGKRSATIVFDLKDPSDIPLIAEPFFREVHASLELTPVMNVDDLKAGLEKAGKSR